MWGEKALTIRKWVQKLKLFFISPSIAMDYLGCRSRRMVCPSHFHQNGQEQCLSPLLIMPCCKCESKHKVCLNPTAIRNKNTSAGSSSGADMLTNKGMGIWVWWQMFYLMYRRSQCCHEAKLPQFVTPPSPHEGVFNKHRKQCSFSLGVHSNDCKGIFDI